MWLLYNNDMKEKKDDTRDPLYKEISLKIIDFMIEQHWQEGDKIPNEYELAQVFHVGRGTVRKAIAELVRIHILEIRRGKGTFVCENLHFHDEKIREAYHAMEYDRGLYLLQIRALIEPWAAKENKLSAPVRSAWLAYEKADGEQRMEQDIAFHEAILASTANPLLPQLNRYVSDSIKAIDDARPDEAFFGRVQKEHRQICEAIEEGDHDLAYALVLAHIEHDSEFLKEAKHAIL